MVCTSGEVLWLAPRFHQNVICLILSLHYNIMITFSFLFKGREWKGENLSRKHSNTNFKCNKPTTGCLYNRICSYRKFSNGGLFNGCSFTVLCSIPAGGIPLLCHRLPDVQHVEFQSFTSPRIPTFNYFTQSEWCSCHTNQSECRR